MSEVTSLPFRQIHLDFHTSPLIPDVGVDFDPMDFRFHSPTEIRFGPDKLVEVARQQRNMVTGLYLTTIWNSSIVKVPLDVDIQGGVDGSARFDLRFEDSAFGAQQAAHRVTGRWLWLSEVVSADLRATPCHVGLYI